MAQERKLLEDVGSCFSSSHFLDILQWYSAHAWDLGNLRNSFTRWPNLKVFAELLTPASRRSSGPKNSSTVAQTYSKGNLMGRLSPNCPDSTPELLGSCCRKKHVIFTSPVFKNTVIIYWKGILETFTRWPNSAPELLLMLLAVIFRYSTVIIERESWKLSPDGPTRLHEMLLTYFSQVMFSFWRYLYGDTLLKGTL